MKDYILYYDSGTSNTRAYLLNRDFQVKYTVKKAVGSKDSAIAGSNRVLIEGMKELYDDVLSANALEEGDIDAIYASGMITSPYGLKEVPHLALPLTVGGLAAGLVRPDELAVEQVRAFFYHFYHGSSSCFSSCLGGPEGPAVPMV